MALLFFTHFSLSDRYNFCITVYASKMVHSLEQRIFLVIEFHHLDLDHSFQRKFKVRNSLVNSIIQALFEKFQRTRNVNADPAGNIGRQSTAISETYAVVVQ